jgi:basic membrane protein A
LRKKRFWAGALAALMAAGALAIVLAGSSSAHPSATFKAALISDIGRFNDKSFNQSQLFGLNRAVAVLHIQKIALQSNSSSDYIPNMTTAIREGANLVMAAGFLMAGDVATEAAQFPKVHFTITDDAVSGPLNTDFKGKDVHNIEGLTYATNESSYLVGCMAALVTVKYDHAKPVIGAVMGIKIPPVDIFLAGYQAGAKKCVPNITVLHGYSNSFTAQDVCKSIAENQIKQGAHVIFQIAGGCGLGALGAAKDAGIWGVGVDQDQSFLGTHILTSAVKRVDTGIFLAIKAAKAGKYKGGTNVSYNLANHGVYLGKFSPKLKKSEVKALNARLNVLKKLIISGKIVVPRTL